MLQLLVLLLVLLLGHLLHRLAELRSITGPTQEVGCNERAFKLDSACIMNDEMIQFDHDRRPGVRQVKLSTVVLNPSYVELKQLPIDFPLMEEAEDCLASMFDHLTLHTTVVSCWYSQLT